MMGRISLNPLLMKHKKSLLMLEPAPFGWCAVEATGGLGPYEEWRSQSFRCIALHIPTFSLVLMCQSLLKDFIYHVVAMTLSEKALIFTCPVVDLTLAVGIRPVCKVRRVIVMVRVSARPQRRGATYCLLKESFDRAKSLGSEGIADSP